MPSAAVTGVRLRKSSRVILEPSHTSSSMHRQTHAARVANTLSWRTSSSLELSLRPLLRESGGRRQNRAVTRYLHMRTERLRLDAVTSGDLDEVHTLHADPKVWRHLPSGHHDSREGTAAFIARIEGDWAAEGLGYWAVRPRGRPAVELAGGG